MSTLIRTTSVAILVALGLALAARAAEPVTTTPVKTPSLEQLRRDFNEPPMERRIRAWWFWCGIDATKESITRDLEYMKRAGMGGAMIMQHTSWHGPATVNMYSDEYYGLVQHTIAEADRLGLKLGMHQSAGYSGMGGPWVRPEEGVHILSVESLQVKGPQAISQPWPVPAYQKMPWAYGHLDGGQKFDRGLARQVAVLAVPAVFPLSGGPGEGPLSPEAVDAKRVVRLDEAISKEGVFTWNVPEGDWTVLRFLSQPTGKPMHPCPAGGHGLEVDKWNETLVQRTLEQNMGRIIREAGPLAGKVLDGIEIDSYEAGKADWTPGMVALFRQKCGYDLVPWLPALAGVTLESAERTKRFLWDYQRTKSLLWADYARITREWANRHGLLLYAEPFYYQANGVEAFSQVDIPMSENWVSWEPEQTRGRSDGAKKSLIPSIADFWGRNVCAFETFTCTPMTNPGLWRIHPGFLKRLGDGILNSGFNRLILHCYTHQTSDDRPGPLVYGSFFGRQQTWAEQARAWYLHVGRVQTMLQQLPGVADVLAVEDETVGASNFPNLIGYEMDACPASALAKVSVRDGRVIGPTGKAYAALALTTAKTSFKERRMTPEVLRELARLAEAGAAIYDGGTKPSASPSLRDHPRCDEEVQRLAAALWDQGKIKKTGMLAGLTPDIAGQKNLGWSHRRGGDVDVYFLANGGGTWTGEVKFRVTGKVPELWHPERNTMERIAVYREDANQTAIPLRFDEDESYFIVFRPGQDAEREHVVALDGPAGGRLCWRDGKLFMTAAEAGQWRLQGAEGRTATVTVPAPPAPLTVDGPWELSFPPNLGAPPKIELPKLRNLIEFDDLGIKGFSGTMTYRTKFTCPADSIRGDLVWELDLGAVQQLAEVRLNGKNLGITYRAPHVLPIGTALKAGENVLEVEVTNTWENRIRADQSLEPAKRVHKGGHTVGNKWSWQDSGLIGPVLVRAHRQVECRP